MSSLGGRWTVFASCAFVALLALVPAAAHACLREEGLDLSIVRLADVVVKGQLVDYEYVEGDAGKTERRHARLKIRTLETLKGEERDEWEFLWDAGSALFGPQKERPADLVFVLGAIRGNGSSGRYDGKWLGAPSNAHTSDYYVMQELCSPPLILTPDDDKLETVLSLMNAKD